MTLTEKAAVACIEKIAATNYDLGLTLADLAAAQRAVIEDLERGHVAKRYIRRLRVVHDAIIDVATAELGICKMTAQAAALAGAEVAE
jgi:hypothetical protein